jgi:hypothetical protein
VGGGVAGGIGGGVATTVSGQIGGIRRKATSGTTTTFSSDRADDMLATTIAQGYGTRGMLISKAGGSINLLTAPDGAVLHTGGGAITVGSSGGFLSATTGGGDIELLRVSGDASVRTGAGDVTISVINDGTRAHSVLVRSGHGRVEIELPADLDARFDLETAYTENFSRATRIDTDWALDRSETSTWDDREGTPRRYVRAQGVVGGGRGLIRIRTVNGDVTVRRVP